MADSLSVTYDFVLPEVGASDDTWGAKLNANWAALDALFTAAFTGGTPSALGKLDQSVIPGILTVEATNPELRFHDSDATVGEYRFAVSGENIFFQRSTSTPGFGFMETVWSYNALTPALVIAKAVQFNVMPLVNSSTKNLVAGCLADLGADTNDANTIPLGMPIMARYEGASNKSLGNIVSGDDLRPSNTNGTFASSPLDEDWSFVCLGDINVGETSADRTTLWMRVI